MQPFVIAVAPNGARRTKADHPGIPMTAEELVKTAHECADAGATMLHFHVRDASGRHSLDPDLYRKTFTLLQNEVGDKLLLQVSSEAAGIYSANEQIDCMQKLEPHCLSIGLREIFRSLADYESGHCFLSRLHRMRTLIQYILYSPQEVLWYEKLKTEGIIPGSHHFLLFVLGSYAHPNQIPHPLSEYLTALKQPTNWMACGFGHMEAKIAREAAELGGHIRVGFENNLLMPDGRTAPDNSALVELAVQAGKKANRSRGTFHDATDLYL